MNSARLLLALAVLTFANGAFAQPASERSTVIVLALESDLEERDDARLATTALLEALRQRPELDVVDQSDVSMGDLLLMEGCDVPSPNCLAASALVAGADQLLYGKVDSFGDDLLVILRVYVAATGELAPVYSLKIERAALASTLAQDINNVIEVANWGLPATLAIESEPSNARVFVDNTEHSRTPIAGLSLEPGAHTVRVEADEHLAWEQPVELTRGRVVRLKPTLRPQLGAGSADLDPEPPVALEPAELVYEAPIAGWVTLGVGVAAFGAATVTGILEQQAESDFDAETRERPAYELRDKAESLALATNVLLGLGGATLLSSALCFAFLGEWVPVELELGEHVGVGVRLVF